MSLSQRLRAISRRLPLSRSTKRFDRIRKAEQSWKYQPSQNVLDLLNNYHRNPTELHRLVLADAMEDEGHPLANHMRDLWQIGNLSRQRAAGSLQAMIQPEWVARGFHEIENGIPDSPWRHGESWKGRISHMVMEPGDYDSKPAPEPHPETRQMITEKSGRFGAPQSPSRLTVERNRRARRSSLQRYIDNRRQWESLSRRGPVIRKAHPTHRIIVPQEHEIGNILNWAPKYLNDYEKNRVHLHRNVISAQLAGLTPIQDLLQIMWAGRVMKDWYHEKGQIHKIFTSHPLNKDDRDLFRDLSVATAFSGRNPVPIAEKGKEMFMRAWNTGSIVKGHVIPPRTDDPDEYKMIMNGIFRTGDIRFPKNHPLYPGQPMMSRRATGGLMMRVMGLGGKEAWAPLGGGIMDNTHITPALRALTNLQKMMSDTYLKFDSPKYNQFYHNHDQVTPISILAHDKSSGVTVDVWDAMMKNLQNLGKEGVYHLGQAIGRHVAALSQDPNNNPHFDDPKYSSGVRANEGQAAGWSGLRGLVLMAALKANRHLNPRELVERTKNLDIYKANSPSLIYGMGVPELGIHGDPDMTALIKDRVLEGTLPEDTFDKLERNAKRFQPSLSELAEPISYNPEALTGMAQKAINLGKQRARGEALQAAKFQPPKG